MLRLAITNPALASALRMVLRAALEGPVEALSVHGCDLVITTTADTSPGACRALSERGDCVLVLAPVVTANERARYVSAGAREYLEMTADTGALIRAVGDAAKLGCAS